MRFQTSMIITTIINAIIKCIAVLTASIIRLIVAAFIFLLSYCCYETYLIACFATELCGDQCKTVIDHFLIVRVCDVLKFRLFLMNPSVYTWPARHFASPVHVL